MNARWFVVLVLAVVLLGTLPVQATPRARPANQMLVPAPTHAGVIDGGARHFCAVRRDGTVACWGWNNFGQATPPVGTFTQVSTGVTHSCGLRTDGTVACWGRPSFGQTAAPSGTFLEVTAGHTHSCGLRTDGTITCWGENEEGGATPPTGTFRQVSASIWWGCGLRTDGTVACWGHNGHGRATPPSGTFIQISLGVQHACALKSDGTIVCWGNSADGRTTPLEGSFRQISVNGAFGCGLRTDNTAACWGLNDFGQATPPPDTFVELAAGHTNVCGLKRDSTVTCWGENNDGRLSPPADPIGVPGAPGTVPTDPAFNQVWAATDRAVQQGQTTRSWLWGPAPYTTRYEPYPQHPAGHRLVEYYDKSRMEINSPNHDRTDRFFVTNGLLSIELISGRMKTGDDRLQYEQREPADVPVAGDPAAANPTAPTYRSFNVVATIDQAEAPRRAAAAVGSVVNATLSKDGVVGQDAGLSRYNVPITSYSAELGHNIPSVFQRYLDALPLPGIFVAGLPISEPYWARVRVRGQEQDVLMQAFERRVLTYTPANEPNYRVEMGNVGQHYYQWRYGATPWLR